MRYIPAVPDIRMKASEGGSALLKGVDGKPSTTEHMKWMRIAFSRKVRKVRTTPFLGSLATCKRHCEALGFALGKWRSRTCGTRATRMTRGTMVSENCHSARQGLKARHCSQSVQALTACADSQKGSDRQLARAERGASAKWPGTLRAAGLCRRRGCAWIW